jgi:hypothetical protein
MGGRRAGQGGRGRRRLWRRDRGQVHPDVERGRIDVTVVEPNPSSSLPDVESRHRRQQADRRRHGELRQPDAKRHGVKIVRHGDRRRPDKRTVKLAGGGERRTTG